MSRYPLKQSVSDRYGFVCTECGCYVDEALRPTRGETHADGCRLDPGERWATLGHEDVEHLLQKNTPRGGNLKHKRSRAEVEKADTPRVQIEDTPDPVPVLDGLPDLKLPASVRARLLREMGEGGLHDPR